MWLSPSNIGPPARAVFIAIDVYRSKDLPQLNGCVEGANDLASFFEQPLGLSKSHSSVIGNDRATRATILRSISSLATNDCITFGDPIMIFFAGHASLDNNKMASIIPYDYPQGQPISSNVLNAMITDLASVKGNNIVCILI